MSITISPLLMKELRSRMRDKKTPLWVTLILFITALVIVMVMFFDNNDARDLSGIGSITFYIISSALYFFSAITSATISAATFSMEREQETLEMLLLTRMSGLQLVLGKIYGSMAYILYLVVIFVPIAAVSFIFGGISPWQLMLVFLIIISSAFCYCAMGTFSSIVQKKSNSAVALAYVTILYFLIGFPVMLALPANEIIFDHFAMVSITFVSLYLPFIIFLMELTIGGRLIKTAWITRIAIGFIYYIAVIGMQVGLNELFSSLKEELIYSVNPIAFGILIFNDSLVSTRMLPVPVFSLFYFIFTALLSAAFIKMSVKRLDLMRRGIGLN